MNDLSREIQLLKGCMRESEVDRVWALSSMPVNRIHHMRSKSVDYPSIFSLYFVLNGWIYVMSFLIYIYIFFLFYFFIFINTY